MSAEDYEGVGPAGAGEERAVTEIDQEKMAEFLEEIRQRQNLVLGIVGGLTASIAGAAIWAAVTVVTGFQIGWMAVGVGFLAGGAVRFLGRGIDASFGYAGAALSLFGCLLGNFLSLCAIVAQEEGIGLFTALTHLNPAGIPEAMVATFHPMDLLFYGIAVYEGYRFSFRRLSQADIAHLAVPTD